MYISKASRPSMWPSQPPIQGVKRYLTQGVNLQRLRMHEVGSEVLTSVVMNSSVFWDITVYSLLKAKRRFGGTCRLHLQGLKISRARTQRESWWKAE
jgi:hypothetical protein